MKINSRRKNVSNKNFNIKEFSKIILLPPETPSFAKPLPCPRKKLLVFCHL